MIKTTITPANTDLHIALPQSYVGKKLELILYSVDEAVDVDTPVVKRPKPSDFAGTLSKEDAKKMLQYVEQSRNEWERDI